jgi:Putative metal-binding motif
MVVLLLACAPDSAAPDPAETVDTASDTDPDTAQDTDTATTDSETDTEPQAVDFDQDGFDETEDCDEANPWVYPGAPEYCDAIDQDCDGEALAPGVCSVRGLVPAGV